MKKYLKNIFLFGNLQSKAYIINYYLKLKHLKKLLTGHPTFKTLIRRACISHQISPQLTLKKERKA